MHTVGMSVKDGATPTKNGKSVGMTARWLTPSEALEAVWVRNLQAEKEVHRRLTSGDFKPEDASALGARVQSTPLPPKTSKRTRKGKTATV